MAVKLPRTGGRVGQPAILSVKDMLGARARDLGTGQIREPGA